MFYIVPKLNGGCTLSSYHNYVNYEPQSVDYDLTCNSLAEHHLHQAFFDFDF